MDRKWQTASIFEHLSIITDPRVERTKLHKLEDIIILAVIAVICGCDNWVEIEYFGEVREEWLKTFLELENGIPSHDTIARVFSMLNPDEFRQFFIRWVTDLAQTGGREIIAIDGKTSRRARTGEQPALHMVSAWASENKLVLGQIKTDIKSNEITAIPKLLDLLQIKGKIITVDAMGCQKHIAKKIVDKGGDYVFGLKGNQGDLNREVSLFLKDAKQDKFFQGEKDVFTETEKGHGRIETRAYFVSSDIDWLEKKSNWEGLRSIGMVECERIIGDISTKEIRYYISSLECNAREFAKAVRQHWSIENSLHWVLDMVFREDESRIRRAHAPENFAVLRHMAVSLLKQEKSLKNGIKLKRLACSMDLNYLAKVIFNDF